MYKRRYPTMPGLSGLITKQVTKSTPNKAPITNTPPLIPKLPPPPEQLTAQIASRLPPPLPPPPTGGTPTTYNQATAAQILAIIRTTDTAVETISAQCGVPAHTWWDWIARYPELEEEYSVSMRTRARAEVERREAEWQHITELATTAASPTELAKVDTLSRVYDRRYRVTAWRAERHHPAAYASRALIGVQQLDPTALMAQGQAWRDPSQAIEQQQDTTTQAPGSSLDNDTSAART